MITHESQLASARRYRLPRRKIPGFLWSALTKKGRSIAQDEQYALATLEVVPEIIGDHHIPTKGPCLVTCNHYTRPGFGAWWLVLLISGAVAARRAPAADPDIQWVMTAAWSFPGNRWRRKLMTPLTRWAFARVAHIYGFITMPPMPPAANETAARALAVRETLRAAKMASRIGGLIGLAPEGQDFAGKLGPLPPGAGDFLALLTQTGLPILPVGVGECEGKLRLAFGPCYSPELPSRRVDRDGSVGLQVMSEIADLLS